MTIDKSVLDAISKLANYAQPKLEEDKQKPSVSSSKYAWEVLDSTGKVDKSFPKTDEGRAQAQKYLKTHWERLSESVKLEEAKRKPKIDPEDDPTEDYDAYIRKRARIHHANGQRYITLFKDKQHVADAQHAELNKDPNMPKVKLPESVEANKKHYTVTHDTANFEYLVHQPGKMPVKKFKYTDAEDRASAKEAAKFHAQRLSEETQIKEMAASGPKRDMEEIINNTRIHPADIYRNKDGSIDKEKTIRAHVERCAKTFTSLGHGYPTHYSIGDTGKVTLRRVSDGRLPNKRVSASEFKTAHAKINRTVSLGSTSVHEAATATDTVKALTDTVTVLTDIVNKAIAVADVIQTAHWNLRSPNFISLHTWFGKTYDDLHQIADEVAEQIKIIDINNTISVTRLSAPVETDEQTILRQISRELQSLLDTLETAAAYKGLNRTTQNLIDGWTASVSKMKWFVDSSIENEEEEDEGED